MILHCFINALNAKGDVCLITLPFPTTFLCLRFITISIPNPWWSLVNFIEKLVITVI